MIESEKKRSDALCDQHLRALKLQGSSASTIDVYSRAVRRLVAYFDRVPDQLSVEQLAVRDLSLFVLAVALIQPTLNILMQNASDEGLVGNTFCQGSLLQPT